MDSLSLWFVVVTDLVHSCIIDTAEATHITLISLIVRTKQEWAVVFITDRKTCFIISSLSRCVISRQHK